MACVIYSEKYGVFLGTAMGLAFWSKLETAGQEAAPVFDSADEAMGFLATWPELSGPSDEMLGVEFVQVVPDVRNEGGASYASNAACIAAGLPGWITEIPVGDHERIYGERPVLH